MRSDDNTPPHGTVSDELRERLVSEIPAWYSPWAHLGVPALFGVSLIGLMLSLLRHLRPIELLTVPAVWLMSNIVEWQVHKDVLHHRFRPLVELYERHTPIHHRIFVDNDMAMRSSREFRLVLIPFWGIAAITLLDLPIALLIAKLGHRNVAALFIATSAFYVLSYEWLHLGYHLPDTHPIARLSFIRRLKRHHATHHDPSLMQRYNFNVTVPFWDWVRGTTYRGQGPARTAKGRR